LDLLLSRQDTAASKQADDGLVTLEGESPHIKFLRDSIARLYDASRSERSQLLVRLVLSNKEGFVIRCDFLSRRLEGCPLAETVTSFLEPLARVRAAPENRDVTPETILSLASQAVGGIIALNPVTSPFAELIGGLDAELDNRISFPWTSSQPILPRRLAWVQGRDSFESIHRAFEGAWALGIALVILDEAGHWLEDDNGPYAYLREAFIPMSIDMDADFPQRIADAVRAYPLPIHGVVAISDVRLASIAKASEILGLPTEPYQAYKLASDKGTTRLMEEEKQGDFTAVVSSVQELDDILAQRHEDISFPLIVKPCTGWNSDCVSKVKTIDELRTAVSKASDRHKNAPTPSTRAVIEPYISGPEVDANFIFLNGEILYYQVSDDFPSTGDTPAAARSAAEAAAPNFMETIMMLPSGLPDDEQLILRDSLKDSIFRQGFQSGVIHCEARVRDSRATYEPRADNGLVDLKIPDKAQSHPQASCYLHEINARPPGYFSSVSVMLTHGIDYYAVRMLFALGDADERIRALSMPFRNQSQYTMGIAVFPGTRTGIMETPDAILEMLDNYPWMREWIADYQTMRKGGSKVFGPDESELWYVGYASVISRTSRKECLERIKTVKELFTYKLVGE
jgi:hypothetical protein